MKKIYLALSALLTAGWAMAAITSFPSPAVTNKSLKVTISGNFGEKAYLYTWCEDVDGKVVSPFEWGKVMTDQFLMTKTADGYTFSIKNIKQFYNLTDAQLTGLKKLGFIVRPAAGGQGGNEFVEVVLGRTDAYSGGEGTKEKPFLISKAKDLADLAAYPMDWSSDVWFKQTASFEGGSITPIGSIGNPYKGHYDGNGYAIKNLKITQSAFGQSAGLFGATDGASISKLALIDETVEGNGYVGGLIGYATSSTIDQCYTSGSISSTSVVAGGLVGVNMRSGITNTYSTASVSAQNQNAIGGLVGKNMGSVKSSYATGSVAGKDYLGGVIGVNYGVVESSAAVNAKISSNENFVARFAGNLNSEGKSIGNISWKEIPTGHPTWSEYGDHSLSPTVNLLSKSTYQKTLGWDFNNIWFWKTVNGRSFPILSVMKDESADPFSSDFYASAIDNVAGDATGNAISMNIANSAIMLQSASGIHSFSLYSVGGSTVKTGMPKSDYATIDIANLVSGTYILQAVNNAGERATYSIIKK